MVVDDYKKIWRVILNLSENHKFLDVSHLSIPFSAINDSNKSQDIYVGQEKISFKDRNQDYKKIFIQEFLT